MPRRSHEWYGELTVWEAGEETHVMKHEWPNHCTELPPGALMRLLKVRVLQSEMRRELILCTLDYSSDRHLHPVCRSSRWPRSNRASERHRRPSHC